MSRIITLTNPIQSTPRSKLPVERREPPPEAQRELQEAFPDCFYEWMPNAKRWAVKRRVPWDQIDRLAKEGKITQEDIDAYREMRQMDGLGDAGGEIIVHAFTVQDPETGEPIEPCSMVVEAMKRADAYRHPGGIRGALKEVIERNKKREQELDQWITDAIDAAVEKYAPWLRQLPRMFYSDPEVLKKKNEQGHGTDRGGEAAGS